MLHQLGEKACRNMISVCVFFAYVTDGDVCCPRHSEKLPEFDFSRQLKTTVGKTLESKNWLTDKPVDLSV